MTGRVKSFCPKRGAGLIETEDGLDALFEIADVLTYDRIGLKPGKVVSFEPGSATPMHAYEIVVRTGIAEPPNPTKTKEAEDLRYTGFSYDGASRVYAFEERIAGEETRQFRVVTEVELLLKHRISLQDTPTICLKLLQTKLAAHLFPNGLKLVQCLLSDSDIRNFISKREVVKPRFHPKPKRPVRGPAPAFGAQPSGHTAANGSGANVSGAEGAGAAPVRGGNMNFAYGAERH